mmetsp:Transcript_48154/g.73309  ORF Transcript_48154/g.73309 Transcript_48154/m.73309 type:complete len:111 (-) Transcript_48154:52-384(-)
MSDLAADKVSSSMRAQFSAIPQSVQSHVLLDEFREVLGVAKLANAAEKLRLVQRQNLVLIMLHSDDAVRNLPIRSYQRIPVPNDSNQMIHAVSMLSNTHSRVSTAEKESF